MREERLTLFSYLAVCIFWGSTYLAIRIGVQDFPPMLFAGIRFLIAGGVMLGFAAVKRMAFPERLQDYRDFSIVGLFLLLGGNGLVVYAEQWVHSGITALLVATMPLFMALIEFFLSKDQRLSLKGWLGLLVGFGGVCWLVLSKDLSDAVDPVGAGLLLLACFLWAAGSVYSKKVKATGSVVSHIGIQMLAGGISLTAIGLATGEAGRIVLTARGLGSMAYLIVFGSIVGYSCFVYLLQKWPAARVGTYAYVNPVVAVLLGAVVLNEKLTPSVGVATVIILSGVLLVQTAKTGVQKKTGPVRPRTDCTEEA